MGKILDRVANGPEDSIQFFYEGIEAPFQQKRDVALV